MFSKKKEKELNGKERKKKRKETKELIVLQRINTLFFFLKWVPVSLTQAVSL